MTFYHRNYEWHNPDNKDCKFTTSVGVASPDADWCSCPKPVVEDKGLWQINFGIHPQVTDAQADIDWEGLVWGTYDGRMIPIDQMDRHHTWNTIRMLERKGAANDLITRAMRKHLGKVSKREERIFRLKNIAYRITHPWFRRH